MEIPTIVPARVQVAPPDPLRERRLALIEQLAYAGPERFNLASVFSTIEGDGLPVDGSSQEDEYGDIHATTYYDLITQASNGELEDTTAMETIADAVTFGTCGRTACLGGHAQIAWYREHQEWISFDQAMARFELPAVACAMHVSPDHPKHKAYEFIMDELGESEEYAEWLISIMVIRDLIDGRRDTVELAGPREYDEFDEPDGPF